MNKLLERKQVKIEYRQQPLQDNLMNNAYYEPSYNVYQPQECVNNQYAQVRDNYNYNGYAQQYTQNRYENDIQSYQNNQSEMYAQQQQRGYVRPTEQYYVQQPVKKEKTKKARLNVKAKLLIGVYFFIVAVIATLLLINMAAGTTTVSADSEEFVAVDESTINYYITEDGKKVVLDSSNTPVVDYSYDVQTNWFDDLCDNITNKAGK